MVGMKVVSWNVNGIRAVARKGALQEVMTALSPDILLIQETKAREDQLPDDIRLIPGYGSYFNAHHDKGGYSGTAIYTKLIKPHKVEYGMGIPHLDAEGRMVTIRYDDLAVVNTYFPNGGQGPERLAYKLEFYEHFLEYVNALRKHSPVIWGGDINTAHEEIDLARPRENMENTGFLPEERAWLDEVVQAGWVDSFRHFHPAKEGAYTYWDMKTRARERNVGWRIDYIFVSPDLLPILKKASIHDSLFGSDHCPISTDVSL
jgi:exodeoxyribonuclease III